MRNPHPEAWTHRQWADYWWRQAARFVAEARAAEDPRIRRIAVRYARMAGGHARLYRRMAAGVAS